MLSIINMDNELAKVYPEGKSELAMVVDWTPTPAPSKYPIIVKPYVYAVTGWRDRTSAYHREGAHRYSIVRESLGGVHQSGMALVQLFYLPMVCLGNLQQGKA